MATPLRLPTGKTAKFAAASLTVAASLPFLASVALAQNLLQYSEELEKWTMVRGIRVTANSTAAPDGAKTADTIADSLTLNSARISANTVNTAQAGPYTFSIYLKAGTLTQAIICTRNGATGDHSGFKSVTLTPSWQRFSVTTAPLKVGAPITAEVHPGIYDRDNGFVYAWGAQLEPGSTPTAYEKTTIGPAPVLDTTPPAAPSGLSTSATTSVQLTWAANQETDLAGYKVYRAAAGSSTYAAIGTPTTPTLTDSGVSVGKGYSYRVTAVDKSGNESPASVTVNATVPVPDTTPPPVPTSLQAQAGKSVTLTWAASTASDIAGYKVLRAPAGSSAYAQIGAPTAATLVDSSVTPGLAYTYQVSALDKTGNESARSAAASTTIPVDAPSGLTAAVASQKVELTWAAPAGSLSGYRVERATGSTGTKFLQIAAPTAAAYVDATVASGMSYTYRVYAVGTAGNASPASAAAIAELPDVTPPAAPAGLTAQAGKTVQLNWTANAEADLAGYKVYRALGTGTFAELAGVASPAHADSTATGGLAYGYRVTALDKSGNESAPSTVASATIPVDAPSGVTAALVSGKIEVKWTAPAGSLSGYRVERGVNSTSSFAAVATPSTTGHLDAGITAGNSYSYRVFALGAAGNTSPASAIATVAVPLPEPPPSTGENPNLIHYSEEFEKWTPIRTPTVAPNATTAPDGQPTADKLTDNAGVDGARIDANTITSQGSAYTYSVFLKSGSLSTAILCIREGANGSHLAFKQVTLTSQWQRYSVTTAGIAAGKLMVPEVHAGVYDRDNGYVFVWGAQYEKGTAATTYKKTPATKAPTADTTAPAVPSGLKATAAASSVALTWTANAESDLAGYRVFRSTAQSGTYAQIGSPTAAALTDTNVTAGSTYWYKVAAVDDAGNASAHSSAVSAAVPQIVVTVPVPTGLTATLANNEVTVKWNALTGIAGFRLERGINSTTSFSSLASPTGTLHIDAGVSGGNSYAYRLCAVDAAGNVSAPTAPVSVNVPLAPPPSTGALNVVSFGANPARAGDDRAAIQAAMNAAVAQNKDLYFPAGYYWLSGRVTFLKASGRTLFGDGMTASIIAGDTNKDSLFQIERTTNVTIRDLRFEGSLVNQQNINIWPAIEPFLSTGTTVRKVHSYGTGYLVRDNSATGTTVEECVCEDYGRIGYLNGVGATLRNCKFICRPTWVFGDQMNGIYSSAGKSNVLIEGNQFIHCGSYAVTLWGSNSGVFTENFLIQNNYFERCDRALVIACSDSGPNYRNVKFLNNTVKQCADKSIHIGKFNGSNADGSALVIDGNIFEDPGSDMAIFMTNWNASGPIRGVRITNNEFRQPTKSAYYGIYLWQNVAPFSDVIVENNVMSDIGHNGTTEKAHCGIYLRSGTVTIRNNHLSHWANAGASLTVDGIRVDSGASNCVLTANTFNGNAKPGCYGVRMTGSGTSANGSITNNLFRSAKLSPNGIPSSGNTVQ